MTRWVTVGRVGRAHGLDGSFVVEAASEDPERLAVGALVHVQGDGARVVSSKRAGGKTVVRLDRTVERGAALEVEASQLSPTEDGEYYVFELVGLVVEEEEGARLGTVVEVAPGIANDVLELDSGHALPLVEECVREIDLAGGRIVVAPGFGESI